MSDSTENFSLIVGLGNPGSEYAGTRHNAGFMVLEKLLAAPVFGRFEKSHTADSMLFSGRFRGRSLMLQMPLTYMNESGRAVGTLCRRLGIAPEQVLVISDDLDLPLGQLRIRRGGSDGGHNGLKSVIAELQSSAFARLRVGIGRDVKVIDYVLSPFSAEELPLWSETVAKAAEAVSDILKSGLARAMNLYNARPAKEAPAEAPAEEVQTSGAVSESTNNN